MGASAADKQARYRARMKAHNNGDHSLCISGNCEALTAVTPVTPVALPGLTRGEAFAARLAHERTMGAAELELARKAGMLTDIIDNLEAYLMGQRTAWLHAAIDRGASDGVEVRVCVDNAVSEIRQQAVALKAVLGELRAWGVAAARAQQGKSGAPTPPALPTAPVAAPAAPNADGTDDDYGDLFATG